MNDKNLMSLAKMRAEVYSGCAAWYGIPFTMKTQNEIRINIPEPTEYISGCVSIL